MADLSAYPCLTAWLPNRGMVGGLKKIEPAWFYHAGRLTFHCVLFDAWLVHVSVHPMAPTGSKLEIWISAADTLQSDWVDN